MICSQNKNFHALVLLKTKLTYWCVIGLRCCAVHQSMHISFLCINPCISAFYVSIHAYQLSMHDRAHSPFFDLDDISKTYGLNVRPESPITGLMHIFIDPTVFGCMLYLRRLTSILNITTALCFWSKSLIICLVFTPTFKDLANLPCGCLKITWVQLNFNLLRAEKHFEIDNPMGNNKQDNF